MNRIYRPFEDRRSVRGISNKYIRIAEDAGFEDINSWIAALIEQLAKKEAQYELIKNQKLE